MQFSVPEILRGSGIINHFHFQHSHSLSKRIKIWVATFCLDRGEYDRDMKIKYVQVTEGEVGGEKTTCDL